MSTEEIEKHIRDHDEAIRNLERAIINTKQDYERTNKEVLEAVRSLHRRLSIAQEYALRDNRLTVDDFKESIKEAAVTQAKECAVHERRISDLEDKAHDFTKAENNILWLDRWVLALSGAFVTFFGYGVYKGMKP